MKKVLFVCHGNICRSPMAQYIFKKMVGNRILVESRATSTEEIGNDMHPKVKTILDKYHIPYQKHYAKQITILDYQKFDLIICFDDYNLYNLQKITGDLSKVKKLLEKDIEDPWYTDDFEKTYYEINEGCKTLVEKLKC